MPSCSAFGCTNRSTQGYLMKVFPRNPVRRALWAAKVKRKDWFPNDHSYLCEVHFDNSQWKPVNTKGKRRLKDTAVPTIFCFTSKQSNVELSSCESQLLANDEKAKSNNYLSASSQDNDESQDKIISNRAIVDSKAHNEYNSTYDSYSSSTTESDSHIDEKDRTNFSNQSSEVFEFIKNYSDKNKIITLGKYIVNLERELNIAKKELINKEERINSFKRKLRKARAEKRLIEVTDYEKMIKSIFNDDQIAALYRKSTNYMKWCNLTIEKAIQIKTVCGVEGYNLIRNAIPLPSIRTLQRHLERLKKYPGNKDDIFSCSDDNSE